MGANESDNNYEIFTFDHLDASGRIDDGILYIVVIKYGFGQNRTIH